MPPEHRFPGVYVEEISTLPPSVAEVSTAIAQHQAAIKDFARTLSALTAQLSDAEWTTYMERVKLHGEEAALAWLKARHETP